MFVKGISYDFLLFFCKRFPKILVDDYPHRGTDRSVIVHMFDDVLTKEIGIFKRLTGCSVDLALITGISGGLLGVMNLLKNFFIYIF